MRPLWTKAFADLRRRRVQAAVVLLVVALASGTSALALTLMAQTTNPYDQAFAAQRGAHLQVLFDGTKVSRDQVAATAAAVGASALAVFPETGVDVRVGTVQTPMVLVGRDDPGGPVERLRLTAGRWAAAPGEVVLTQSFARLSRLSPGDSVRVVDLAAKPLLRVVGEASDIDEAPADSGTQKAWVTEAALPGLTRADQLAYFGAYRFATPPTAQDLTRYGDRIRSVLPAGAVTGSADYLLFRTAFTSVNAILTVTLLAFSVFALAASAAIVVNLVGGVVLASYREVGVMKALGYTPGQVVAVFVLQMLAPAALGCVAGVATGTLISQPLLESTAQALGLPPQSQFAPLLDVVAAAGILALVAVAATLPALRAGLLNPVRAIVLGAAPGGSSGVWLRRLLGRRVPRPVGLGAGEAFARPLRAALTVIAVLVGVTTAVFAIGLRQTLERSQVSLTHYGRAQVLITREPAYPDSSVMATLTALPETERIVGSDAFDVDVPGVGSPVTTEAFRGDSASLGYFVLSGRWFRGEGEAVAPRALMADAHLKVGDTFTVTASGRPLQLTLVGETYNINNLGHSIFVDWSTEQAVHPRNEPTLYSVTLKPGSDAGAYVRRVAATEPDFLSVQPVSADLIGPIQEIDSVALVLTLVLGLIAMAGIFTTLLLNTRERVRDIATLKANGMTPGQVLAMVVTSAAALAIAGGVLGLPAGVAVHHAVTYLLQFTIGNDTPAQTLDVYTPVQLVAVLAGGLLVAMLAAALPARSAARTPVAVVLRSE